MANSLHFDGVDLAGVDYGVSVEAGTFPLIAAPRLNSQTIPYMDGAVYQGSFLEPLSIRVHCWVEGISLSDLAIRLDNLRYLFNTTDNKALSFDDYFPDRYWMARLASGIDVTFMNERTAEIDLEFIAPDPKAFSSTATTVSFSAGNYSLSAPSGTGSITPVFTITGSGTSPVTIGNTTTNETLTWNNIFSGILRVDCIRQIVEVSTNGGTSYTPVMVNMSGVFPSIKPKVTNALVLTGLSGTVSLTYRERYL